MVHDWVAGLNDVYILTNDKEAGDQLLFVQKHGVVTEPKEYDILPQREMGVDDFALVPLVEEDKTLSPWGDIIESSGASGYSGPEKVLFLKNDEPISPPFKGTTFAHEIVHRKLNPDGNLSDDEMAFCREDVIAHSFSNRLILKMGGEPYQKLLDEKVAEKIMPTKDSKVPHHSSEYYTEELNKIFGPALSQREVEIRLASFNITALFQWSDRYVGGDKEENKALVMCKKLR